MTLLALQPCHCFNFSWFYSILSQELKTEVIETIFSIREKHQLVKCIK